jgi:hypothetical protein
MIQSAEIPHAEFVPLISEAPVVEDKDKNSDHGRVRKVLCTHLAVRVSEAPLDVRINTTKTSGIIQKVGHQFATLKRIAVSGIWPQGNRR